MVEVPPWYSLGSAIARCPGLPGLALQPLGCATHSGRAAELHNSQMVAFGAPVSPGDVADSAPFIAQVGGGARVSRNGAAAAAPRAARADDAAARGRPTLAERRPPWQPLLREPHRGTRRQAAALPGQRLLVARDAKDGPPREGRGAGAQEALRGDQRHDQRGHRLGGSRHRRGGCTGRRPRGLGLVRGLGGRRGRC